MLIQLNAEVWMGILNWLLKYRREMAEKFAQFGDRDFSEFTQTWLHQWTRNVMLGPLEITRDNLDELAILNRNEMPANITDFSSITIRYFDAEGIKFLRQIQRLLANVNLVVKGVEHSKIVLRQLLPLINETEAIYIDGYNSQLAFFLAEFPTQLYGAGILGIACKNQGEYRDSILLWLFTVREDGQPRTLFLLTSEENALAFVAKIREHFLNPRLPSMCFFVKFLALHSAPFEATTIQNGKGEQLTVRKNTYSWVIARCSSDIGLELLAQKLGELDDYVFLQQKRRIGIFDPEIGPIDEAASGSGHGNN